MAFDDYEYLEKTVEESKNRSKTKEIREKTDREYRKRDVELEDDDERRRKKTRRIDEVSGVERKREERERDREKRREKEDRERRDRREKDKELERRGREKSKEREKEKSKERESRRSRSRSRRSRSREREIRERELRETGIRDRRFKEKKEAVEPEADPERDQRTVFAYQMPLKVTEKDVYEFFSKAGKVRDVRLIMDRNSWRCKGVGNALKISMTGNDGNTLLSC